MKQVQLLLLLIIFSTSGLFAQTAYNPFTQNIHFEVEPTVAGFSCGSFPKVEFTQGITTADSASDWQNNPLLVTISIVGFEYAGTNASTLVTGSYASNFTWAFDPLDATKLIGTQNQVLYGTGSNPLFPDPRSSGDVNVALAVPTTSPIGTTLSCDVSLTVPAYMSTFNSVPDDTESTQTQTFCDLKVIGTVFHDTNRTNIALDRHIGLGNPDNNTLYANLIDSATNNVVKVATVNPNGTFEFLSVPAFTTYEVVLSIVEGVIGNLRPAPQLPPNWRNTGDDCCDGIGNDLAIDGITLVKVDDASRENVDFGITQLIPTPVKMSSFNVSEYSCNTLVSWSTVSEDQVSHFDILRKHGNGSFEQIARIKSSGNSSSEKLYSYVDKEVEKSSTSYQYRLRTVDQDGSAGYTGVKSIKLSCGDVGTSAQIFPNPAKNSLNLVYTTDENDIQLIVDVVDVTGRKLLSKSQIIYQGTSVINMDIESLAVGQYMVRYHSIEGGTTETIKFTKD